MDASTAVRITLQDEQKILNCLGYPNYRRNRDHGTTPALYAKTTGCDVRAFEQKYQLERIQAVMA